MFCFQAENDYSRVFGYFDFNQTFRGTEKNVNLQNFLDIIHKKLSNIYSFAHSPVVNRIKMENRVIKACIFAKMSKKETEQKHRNL